jgi:hypothetical protein
MTSWPAFIALLEPATVTMVGGVAALFGSAALAIQGTQLRVFRAALWVAAIAMALAGVVLLSYSFSVGKLDVNHQGMVTAVSGVLCFHFSLSALLLVARSSVPWHVVTLLGLICLSGFIFIRHPAELTQWANIC